MEMKEIIKAQADAMNRLIIDSWIHPPKPNGQPFRVPFTALNQTVKSMEAEEETLP